MTIDFQKLTPTEAEAVDDLLHNLDLIGVREPFPSELADALQRARHPAEAPA